MNTAEIRIAAIQLTGSSPGLIEKKIRLAHEECRPIQYEIVREALAVECRSFGSRPAVLNTLRREMKRQEELQQVAA